MKLAGAVAITGALLAGCGSGPSKVDAAAIVGNQTIPLGDLQYQVTKVLADKPVARQAQQQHKMDMPTRGLLTIAVQHDLVNQVSGKLGLQADPGQVQQAMQSPQLDQTLQNQVFDRDSYAQYLTDRTKLEDLARKQAPGLQVTMDLAMVGDPNQAKDIARKIAASPQDTQQLMQSAGGKVSMGEKISPMEDLQTAVSTPLFAAKEGTVVAFPSGGQSTQWFVARVISRQQGPATKAATQQLKQVDPASLAELGQMLLAPYAQQIGVTVNPRYGVWDDLALAVAADDSQKKGFTYPVAAGSS